MANPTSSDASQLKRITSLKAALGNSDSTQIYIVNAKYANDAVATLSARKNPRIPCPAICRTLSQGFDWEKWNLTLVPGRVNVYTLKNVASNLYATVDEIPDKDDVVVESTSRSWKISQGSLSVKGDPTFEITPTGTQENVLFWSQDSAPDSNPNLPTVAVSLQKRNGVNTSWLLLTE